MLDLLPNGDETPGLPGQPGGPGGPGGPGSPPEQCVEVGIVLVINLVLGILLYFLVLCLRNSRWVYLCCCSVYELCLFLFYYSTVVVFNKVICWLTTLNKMLAWIED